jgi:hypothetical protein
MGRDCASERVTIALAEGRPRRWALAAAARPLRASGNAEDGWRVRSGCPARADHRPWPP